MRDKKIAAPFQIILWVILLFSISSYAASIHVEKGNDITAIVPYVTDTTLVVLDLDDTLIRSKTTLGSPACFYKLREWYESQSSLCKEEVFRAFLSFDLALQRHVDFTLVDERVAALTEKFQDLGIPVIGLTSRPEVLSEVTHKILKNLNIQLGKAVSQTRTELQTSSPALYDRGILYVGDHNTKSSVLNVFIEKLLPNKQKYTGIVFVDDKEMYVRDLEKYARQNHYDYFGLYYIKEKDKQRTINLHTAKEQIKHLFVYSKDPLHNDGNITPVDDKTVLQLFFNCPPQKEGYFYFQGSILPDSLIILHPDQTE